MMQVAMSLAKCLLAWDRLKCMRYLGRRSEIRRVDGAIVSNLLGVACFKQAGMC